MLQTDAMSFVQVRSLLEGFSFTGKKILAESKLGSTYTIDLPRLMKHICVFLFVLVWKRFGAHISTYPKVPW